MLLSVLVRVVFLLLLLRCICIPQYYGEYLRLQSFLSKKVIYFLINPLAAIIYKDGKSLCFGKTLGSFWALGFWFIGEGLGICYHLQQQYTKSLLFIHAFDAWMNSLL